MCGIAGYCISDEFRDKLDHDKLNMLMRAGFATNVHRGRDAAGFFIGYNLPTPDPDGNCSLWWKHKDKATEHLDTFEKIMREHPIPNVLGLHARASSGNFTADLNSNNHPVQHNSVLAIHNGYIRNHLEIKRFTEIKPDKVHDAELKPAVDSVAIAMLMDLFDPGNLIGNEEEIAHKLALLSGGWATHIMWAKDPTISLLVAGPSYPLTVQYGRGRLAYASEEQSLLAMWNAAATPFPKRTNARVMDPGTFMFVSNGEPISYGRYDVERKAYEKVLLDHKVLTRPGIDNHQRYNPKTNHTSLVTRHKRKYKEEETEQRRLWTSFRCGDDGMVLIYDVKVGLIVHNGTEDVFKALTPANNFKKEQGFVHGAALTDHPEKLWCDLFLEADMIYAVNRGNRDVDLFGWFGNTEICITDTGSILNVFDWEDESDRVIWERDDSFDEKRKEALKDYSPLLERHARNVGEDITAFRTWFKAHSEEPKTTAQTGTVGVDRRPLPVPFTQQRKLPLDTILVNGRHGVETPFQFPIILKKASKDWLEKEFYADFVGQAGSIPFVALRDSFEADPFMDIDEVDGSLVYHSATKSNIPFMYNEICPIHDQELTKHSAVHNCDYLLLASLAAHNRILDLEILEYIYFGELKMTVGLHDSTYQMYSECDHQWLPMQSIALEAFNLWWRIPESETCVECMATRSIGVWPENLTMFKKSFQHFDITEGACV